MKRLILVRHAKSSWAEAALADKDRPLNDRGRRDAPRMGKRLAQRKAEPRLILSSPARRALTTAKIIAKKLDYKIKNIAVDDRLYPGEADAVLEVIHALDDGLESVMLVGHNPGLTELARRFASEMPELATCAVAEFKFDAKSWSSIGHPRLVSWELDYPKKP